MITMSSPSAVLSDLEDEVPTVAVAEATTCPVAEVPACPVAEVPACPVAKATATVLALIAHARGVPSAARAAFAEECAALPAHDGLIFIRTCHRVELYVAVGAYGDGELPKLPAGGLRLEDAPAARHLISVACGLQSAVLGEDQVLHQVRETYTLRHEARPLDPVLDRLFQVALNAGRRAHGWFAGAHRSLGDVAIDEIERASGPVEDQPILIVGAGSMSRLAAHAAARRGARVTVTNRSTERALALARDVGGQAVDETSDGELGPFVGAVVAVSGSWAFHPQDATRLVDSGTTVVDLSSPPAVSDDLQARLGEHFVSIDDLAWGTQVELADGLRLRLENLVTDSGGEYCRWLRSREFPPAIHALTDAAEARRLSELAWLKRRLPNLSDQDRATVEQMTHRLVAGILHAPKSALRLDESGELGRAAWQLFGL
jgi:glutamyl-tRNA reductase